MLNFSSNGHSWIATNAAGDLVYEIHTADRMVGDNTGKWVCCYLSPDTEPPGSPEGYLAKGPNGELWYCGGNGMFNAVGLPKEAEYASLEEAKQVCAIHAADPSKAKIHPLLAARAQARRGV